MRNPDKITFRSLLIGVFLVLFFTAKSLNPFDTGLFLFHDPTQAGRVTSFVQNLRSGQFPPRLATEYSFNLGMPVFNFYAPTAYWITSAIALLGVPSVVAVKISFLLTVVGAFLAMYYFLSRWFHPSASLLGASVYVTSTYFATEVMVRGNLAESWWLVLLPLSLGLLVEQSRNARVWLFISTTAALALLFTSHNVLSLFALPTVFLFSFFFPRWKTNVLSIVLALLIDSYFFLPLIFEGSLVQAATIAKQYVYTQHFLCPWQLWSAKGWLFGGSIPGCDADSMSFKLGKLQVLLAAGGMLALVFQIVRSKKITLLQRPVIFLTGIAVGALFLTTSYSQFVWDFFSPIMALFQFPWRFIPFGMVGMAVLAGYLFHTFRFPLRDLAVLGMITVLFISGRKYFIKPLLPLAQYQQEYDSPQYRIFHIAYKVQEYLPVGADHEYWRTLESREDRQVDIGFDPTQPVDFSGKYETLKNTPFEKSVRIEESGKLTVNIHAFPFWKISLNGKAVDTYERDRLARPVLAVAQGDILDIRYEQTFIEKSANLLTVLGLALLSACAVLQYRRRS